MAVPSAQGRLYDMAFTVAYVENGEITHGIGTDNPESVIIDLSGRDSVPDHGNGYKAVFLKVYQDHIVGLLNRDRERVREVIVDLHQQVQSLKDTEVEMGVVDSISYYTQKYDEEKAFVAILEFRQQVRQGSGELQMVARIGQRIAGHNGVGIRVFGKQGIPLSSKSVWVMCVVFMAEHGGDGVAVALPDQDVLLEAISSLDLQEGAIDKMPKVEGLPPASEEARRLKKMLGDLKRA